MNMLYVVRVKRDMDKLSGLLLVVGLLPSVIFVCLYTIMYLASLIFLVIEIMNRK